MSVATSQRKEPTEMNVISKAKDVLYNLLFKEVKENVTTIIEPNDRCEGQVR